jgi:exodeoxyribonuclease VII small subunit
MAEKKLSFEESVSRLDEIVRHLESGDLPLSESLTMFEEGTKLITQCSKMLDAAEQKVVKLKKGPDREPIELPFEDEEK